MRRPIILHCIVTSRPFLLIEFMIIASIISRVRHKYMNKVFDENVFTFCLLYKRRRKYGVFIAGFELQKVRFHVTKTQENFFFFRRNVLGSQRNYRGVVWVQVLVILDILLISILENQLLKSRRLALYCLYRPQSDYTLYLSSGSLSQFRRTSYLNRRPLPDQLRTEPKVTSVIYRVFHYLWTLMQEVIS